MSTLVEFIPSNIAAFQFQPTLDGTQYSVTVLWNLFAQDYYINLSDLTGNLILYRSLTASGPSLQAVFSWSEQVATVVTALNHNVPVGQIANARASQTGTSFDGFYSALSLGPTSMSYPLAVNPQTSPQGTLSFPLNLVAGVLDDCYLFYSDTTQQFEYSG